MRQTLSILTSIVMLSVQLSAQMLVPIVGGSASTTQGFDYYIDSVSGNDITGNGSITLPWKTIAKVQSFLSNGKSVGLKRGSHWREMFDNTSNQYTHLTLAAYGTGAKPIIDASNIITGTDAWGGGWISYVDFGHGNYVVCGRFGCGIWVQQSVR